MDWGDCGPVTEGTYYNLGNVDVTHHYYYTGTYTVIATYCSDPPYYAPDCVSVLQSVDVKNWM